jgi:hypothetical protein
MPDEQDEQASASCPNCDECFVPRMHAYVLKGGRLDSLTHE